MEVVISDTGIGMDEETMRRIFEKFYSAGRELGRSGNGLGLSITKRILELSGGTITVESSPDRAPSLLLRSPSENRMSGPLWNDETDGYTTT